MDETYPDSPAVQGAGAYDNTVPSAYEHETLHKALSNRIRERTKLERLKDAKAGLESKLAEVNNAIRLLEEIQKSWKSSMRWNVQVSKQRNGSPVFYGMLEEMADIHDKKSHDYANNDNPYGNYYFAGLVANLFSHSPNDAGFASRIAEKLYRLSVLEGGRKTPKNESIDDTERDLATIMTLWMASRRERRGEHRTIFETSRGKARTRARKENRVGKEGSDERLQNSNSEGAHHSEEHREQQL